MNPDENNEAIQLGKLILDPAELNGYMGFERETDNPEPGDPDPKYTLSDEGWDRAQKMIEAFAKDPTFTEEDRIMFAFIAQWIGLRPQLTKLLAAIDRRRI